MERPRGLTEDEIRRRLPVWCALTCFFLDTEMTEHDIQHMARVAQKAGYAAAELEAILLEEVAPVFGANLLAVAGEWAPWPESFVEERMRAWIAGSRAGARLAAALARRLLREDWARLQPHLLPVAQPAQH